MPDTTRTIAAGPEDLDRDRAAEQALSLQEEEYVDGRYATEVTSMGNDELEILTCRIPALSQQLACRQARRLADYPLARASEWSPLPSGAIPFDGAGDENEDLVD